MLKCDDIAIIEQLIRKFIAGGFASAGVIFDKSGSIGEDEWYYNGIIETNKAAPPIAFNANITGIAWDMENLDTSPLRVRFYKKVGNTLTAIGTGPISITLALFNVDGKGDNVKIIALTQEV